MSYIDPNKLIEIICKSPAQGHLECIPWEPEHFVNLDGVPQHVSQFEKVSENLYIDMLVCDTIWEVDQIIENMIMNSKDPWGGNV